jgi:hypothetical protein
MFDLLLTPNFQLLTRLTFFSQYESICVESAAKGISYHLGRNSARWSNHNSNTERNPNMTQIKGIIGMGAIALATVTAHAQGVAKPAGSLLPLTITIAATATLQGNDAFSDNGKTATTTSKVTTLKFTQTDIINVVESNFSATPTKEARLVYDNGAINIIDGANTYDASDFVTLTLDPNEHGVWSGTHSTNDVTLAESQKYSGKYVITFVFDQGDGNSVSVSGLAAEKYAIGFPKNNVSAASDTVSLSFAGDGQNSGANGVLLGKLKATAKGSLQH